MTSEPDIPDPDAGPASPVAAADAAASEKGRVLLLERDPAFREVIRECLAGNGYSVVTAEDSRAGLKEVLARDFALVLYDPLTPGLPGDLFYKAVNRVDRELCQRFVFMTGDDNDDATIDFVTRIDGFVLQKPFEAASLLDLIAFAQARGTFERGPKPVVCEPAIANICTPVEESPAAAVPVSELDLDVRLYLPPAQPGPAPVIPAIAPGAGDREGREEGGFPVFAVAGFLLMLGLAAALGKPYVATRDRIADASARRVALGTEWAATSRKLEESLAARAKLQRAQARQARISDFRTAPRWSPALSCMIPKADAMVEIVEVEARGDAENPGACEVRVRGIAGGPRPRQAAEQFRRAAEDNLGKKADGRAVHTHFAWLEGTRAALPDQEKAEFVMIATIRPAEPPIAAGKEKN